MSSEPAPAVPGGWGAGGAAVSCHPSPARRRLATSARPSLEGWRVLGEAEIHQQTSSSEGAAGCSPAPSTELWHGHLHGDQNRECPRGRALQPAQLQQPLLVAWQFHPPLLVLVAGHPTRGTAAQPQPRCPPRELLPSPSSWGDPNSAPSAGHQQQSCPAAGALGLFPALTPRSSPGALPARRAPGHGRCPQDAAPRAGGDGPGAPGEGPRGAEQGTATPRWAPRAAPAPGLAERGCGGQRARRGQGEAPGRGRHRSPLPAARLPSSAARPCPPTPRLPPAPPGTPGGRHRPALLRAPAGSRLPAGSPQPPGAPPPAGPYRSRPGAAPQPRTCRGAVRSSSSSSSAAGPPMAGARRRRGAGPSSAPRPGASAAGRDQDAASSPPPPRHGPARHGEARPRRSLRGSDAGQEGGAAPAPPEPGAARAASRGGHRLPGALLRQEQH